MENRIINDTSCIPELIKNTHLNFSLEGWPAAAAIIVISLSGVAIYGFNCYKK